MDINDILNTLGINLSSKEARRGAVEAINAILSSRAPTQDIDLGGSIVGSGETETEVELDPDLIQPSIKQAPTNNSDDDIEVDDEEDILSKIKHNESEDKIDSPNSNKDSKKQDDSQKADSKPEDSATNKNGSGSESSGSKQQDSNNKEPEHAENKTDRDNSERKTSIGDDEVEEDDLETDDSDAIENQSKQQDEKDSKESNTSNSRNDGFYDDETEHSDDDEYDDDESEDDNESEDDDYNDYLNSDDNSFDVDNTSDSEDSGEEDDDIETSDEEDFEFDEDDFVDDDLKDSTEDETEKTKHGARIMKRERTLSAAKHALADAQARKVSPALIRELEKSIEALEALTEAVAKSIRDVSDEEFNLLVNRVFDAISACGKSDLTFTSDEERQARATEIKADLAKAETQNELSAEDVAKIRAETQAVKAREKEIAKYQAKASGSFKGFQDFLTSLYKAIALQVDNEETRDDSWSAINRRYSGTGILQPGKKINDLPNRRIPIIDFYFDCSLSWDQDDIEVGKKAVAALADLEQKGQIKVNIYYFSNRVSQSYEDVAGESTAAWNYIVKNIIATQASNVVVMTDSDMEGQGKNRAGAVGHLKYTVPGYVWYLWKNGENAPRLPRDLKGRGGTQQFSFNASDV